jgi:hypothetical protein
VKATLAEGGCPCPKPRPWEPLSSRVRASVATPAKPGDPQPFGVRPGAYSDPEYPGAGVEAARVAAIPTHAMLTGTDGLVDEALDHSPVHVDDVDSDARAIHRREDHLDACLRGIGQRTQQYRSISTGVDRIGAVGLRHHSKHRVTTRVDLEVRVDVDCGERGASGNLPAVVVLRERWPAGIVDGEIQRQALHHCDFSADVVGALAARMRGELGPGVAGRVRPGDVAHRVMSVERIDAHEMERESSVHRTGDEHGASARAEAPVLHVGAVSQAVADVVLHLSVSGLGTGRSEHGRREQNRTELGAHGTLLVGPLPSRETRPDRWSKARPARCPWQWGKKELSRGRAACGSSSRRRSRLGRSSSRPAIPACPARSRGHPPVSRRRSGARRCGGPGGRRPRA